MAQCDFSYAKRGLLVRLVYLFVACSFHVVFYLRSRNRAIVLCYHAVTEKQRARFERQMRAIASRAISLDSLLSDSSFENAVSITFDDAFECLIENVVPIAESQGIPISIFAVTENMGRSPGWGMDNARADTNELIMTYSQLSDMGARRVCLIGSHTATHRRLAELETAEIQQELVSSKLKLEEVLSKPVEFLAFPHGSYGSAVLQVAEKASYKAVLSLDEQCVYPDRRGFVWGRFSASPDMWDIEFRLTVEGAYSWLAPWRRFLRRLRAVAKGIR